MCDRMQHVQGPQTNDNETNNFLKAYNFLAYAEKYEWRAGSTSKSRFLMNKHAQKPFFEYSWALKHANLLWCQKKLVTGYNWSYTKRYEKLWSEENINYFITFL